jgi:hypothetical protein
MEVTPTILLQAAANIAKLVSISQIFYEQIFHTKVKLGQILNQTRTDSEFDRKCQIKNLNAKSNLVFKFKFDQISQSNLGQNWSNLTEIGRI